MGGVPGGMGPVWKLGLQGLVAVKAYFDGGNEADSRQYNSVTLVAFAATDPVWRSAEKRWETALKKHGAAYLHMFEAISLNGEFKGWDRNRMRALMYDCIKALRAFKDRPLYSTSCTIFLKDYQRALAVLPDLPKPEYICSGYTLTNVMGWYASAILSLHDAAEFPPGCVSLTFDRNEPFRGHIVDQWNQRKLRKRAIWSAIRSVDEADMRRLPGLQMADMLAWACNRPHGAGGHVELCADILAARKDDHADLGFERLTRPHPERFAAFKKLRLPQRRPSH